MKFLRHPLVIFALVLASCWWAYRAGSQSLVREQASDAKRALSLREKSSFGGGRSRFFEASTDQGRTRLLGERLGGAPSAEDFQNALEAILLEADKSEKNRLLAQLFKRWLEVSPIDAVAQVRRVESLRHDLARTAGVFQQWAQENPTSASALLKEIFNGEQRDPATDPPFLDGVDPPEYILSLFAGLSQVAPQEAADLLSGLPESPALVHALDLLFQNWFPDDPSGIFQWAGSLEASPFRESVISLAGTKSGQLDDPGAGLQWAQSLQDPADQALALKALTDQWSQRHSQAAFQWVTGLPESDLKFSLAPDVLSSLAKIDPGAAADWLNQYDASPQIDPSVAAYALAISNVNPAAALGTAAVITDPAEKKRVSLKIAETWQRQSPESLERYLDTTEELPEYLSGFPR
ncbi:hypothetical protein N9891_00435 [bacterium]|nr:hypothetical protein [bacterium]